MSDQSPSAPVCSPQTAAHPKLEALVRTHVASRWRAPLHGPTVKAFEALTEMAGPVSGVPIVFDSGCGTGESTRRIAAFLPDCLVIGIDKSLARLRRQGAEHFPHREGNAIWVRAELASFWRLALQSGWRLHRHYLLYPNPWPKPRQLRRRWYAHPVFPVVLALGGRLEMRCNWRIYAEEFALAVRIVTGREAVLSTVGDGGITSPFERKYRRSGHELYAVVIPPLPSG